MEHTEKHDKLVNSLQELLQKNYDAEKGYKEVMKKAEFPGLKTWLQNKAAQRSHFANEIDSELRKLNAEPKSSGTVAGSAHRLWIDVKTALSSDKDEAILEECIRGEKSSVEEYEEQLNSQYVTGPVQEMLSRQKSKVESALATVRNLEDLVD